MPQSSQRKVEDPPNVKTIIFITTDYWDFSKHRHDLFKSNDVKLIPFEAIAKKYEAIPSIYEELRVQKIQEIIESETHKQRDLIFSKFPKIKRRFDEKSKLQIKYSEQITTEIRGAINEPRTDGFWTEESNIALYPDQLKMKKVNGHDIFVLPPLPDFHRQDANLKHLYLDFLVHAFIHTFNNDQDIYENTRLVFILHEKDLGLDKEYKENLLKPIDFTKNKSLDHYLSAKIKSNVTSGKYDILVFQHDSASSPNINKNFLIKSKDTDSDLVEKVEKIISLLKVSWGKWYMTRDEMLVRMKAGEDITVIIEELNKLEGDIKQLRQIDSEATDMILNNYKQLDIPTLKDLFDRIFIKANISTIF
jgi:hypothetical protein